jgi:hypothetical protein
MSDDDDLELRTLTSDIRPPSLLVLPGDGIGPEIVAATLEVLAAADRRFGLALACDTAAIGVASLRAAGTTLPDEVVEQAMRADGAILGPVSHNDYRDQGAGVAGIAPRSMAGDQVTRSASVSVKSLPTCCAGCWSLLDLPLEGGGRPRSGREGVTAVPQVRAANEAPQMKHRCHPTPDHLR